MPSNTSSNGRSDEPSCSAFCLAHCFRTPAATDHLALMPWVDPSPYSNRASFSDDDLTIIETHLAESHAHCRISCTKRTLNKKTLLQIVLKLSKAKHCR